MSELVEKMEEMPHETESEFGESGGNALHETESEFGESGGEALHEIKSDFTGAITADRGRGGGGLFSQCGVKPFAQKKIRRICVGFFCIGPVLGGFCFP